jgi:hypothetical protein
MEGKRIPDGKINDNKRNNLIQNCYEKDIIQ